MWPWIRENLGLAVNPYLTDCGTCYGWCCNTYGATVLQEGEPQRIADYLNCSLKDLKELYVMDWFGEEAIVPADPCPFWKNGCCEIQSVKPESCTKYVPRVPNAQICSSIHIKMANKR